MHGNKLSDNFVVDEILALTDIGGTLATSSFVTMTDSRQAMFVCRLTTFVDGPCDTIQLLQAKSSTGLSVKTISGKLITTLDADQIGIIDLDASELDTNNGFTHAAVVFNEAGNTGVDNAQALILRGNFRDKFAQLQGVSVYVQ